MNKDQILKTIKDLAKSQGLYGRILRDMNDEVLEYLEEQNFKDPLDLVLFIECQEVKSYTDETLIVETVTI